MPAIFPRVNRDRYGANLRSSHRKFDFATERPAIYLIPVREHRDGIPSPNVTRKNVVAECPGIRVSIVSRARIPSRFQRGGGHAARLKLEDDDHRREHAAAGRQPRHHPRDWPRGPSGKQSADLLFDIRRPLTLDDAGTLCYRS